MEYTRSNVIPAAAAFWQEYGSDSSGILAGILFWQQRHSGSCVILAATSLPQQRHWTMVSHTTRSVTQHGQSHNAVSFTTWSVTQHGQFHNAVSRTTRSLRPHRTRLHTVIPAKAGIQPPACQNSLPRADRAVQVSLRYCPATRMLSSRFFPIPDDVSPYTVIITGFPPSRPCRIDL